MKTLTVLGSTGSIGTNTLDVVRRSRELYKIHALVAGRNVETLAKQIREFRPRAAVVATPKALADLTQLLTAAGLPRAEWPELSADSAARVQVSVAAEVDTVISAIVGVTGLEATYQAIRHGKRVGLATKEVLVCSGKLVMEAVRQSGAPFVPVDSEHNGAHQCLRAGNRAQVARLILTASGGPFRETPMEALAFVTPAQALKHPTWRMGNRITIDPATMMNKGLEVIEACWLFDFTPAEVGVVIHPQSTVHAMIEYSDGSVLAQVAATDMRMPIQYALTYPERAEAPVPKIDWSQARHWDFYPPDLKKFPLLKLAYECQQQGGSAACTLNAADEVAVEAFLQEKIGYLGIYEVVSECLAKVPVCWPKSVEEVLEIDAESRRVARELTAQRAVPA